MISEKTVIIHGDLENFKHSTALISLINEYRTDTMGGSLSALDRDSENKLIDGLKNHPAALILFAVSENDIITGMAICFEGFSTFQAAGLFNVHDLIVYKHYRKRGIGRSLLEYVCNEAQRRKFCRVTLEVRTDNESAKRLYRSVSFRPCESPMEFWINSLNSDSPAQLNLNC